MKYLVILLIGLLCGRGDKVQLTEATSQEWAGGLEASGYGINYKLSVKVKAGSDKLSFEDLWVGDSHMKIRVIPDERYPQVKTFAKGSQIVLTAGITWRPDEQGRIRALVTDTLRKPINFKGEGLLGYTYKGRKGYMRIESFKILQKIIYP